MDKNILQDYIDACELIRETEQDIRKLESKKETIPQMNVKECSPDFPYQVQHFRIQGTDFAVTDDSRLRFEETVLRKRKDGAERIRRRVEEWMLILPARMQRIVRYRYFEDLSWDQTAVRMGRGATADSIRMELERFLRKR